jgi:glycosyltransferase involved in cell wall biosynthesis
MSLRLSVVVALSDPRFDGRRCLESLLAQTLPPGLDLQVVVVAGGPESETAAAGLREDGHAVVRVAGRKPSLPRLLAAGIEAASGDWVALSEGHCTFTPGWLAAAAAAMKSPAVAVGGTVEPGDLQTVSDWALYFCDYGAFLPPMPGGPASNLPGNNVLFRYAALERLAAPAGKGFWKTFACRRLAAAGERLLADPALIVRFHLRLPITELIARRLTHGRCYGAMRAQLITGRRRTLYAVAAPLLPPLLLARVLRHVWPKGRYRRQLVSSLPCALLAVVAWVVGEWLGNLFGAGQSCERV